MQRIVWELFDLGPLAQSRISDSEERGMQVTRLDSSQRPSAPQGFRDCLELAEAIRQFRLNRAVIL